MHHQNTTSDISKSLFLQSKNLICSLLRGVCTFFENQGVDQPFCDGLGKSLNSP